MDILRNIKALGQATIDLVFPITCLICGKDGVFLCETCVPKLPKEPKQICLVCSLPSAFGKTHPNCVTRNTADGIISALPYKNPQIKQLIEVFKYKFVSDLAHILAGLVVDEIHNQNLTEYFSDFAIIPVPLHQRRFNWRGFNQAQLLAEIISAKLSIPLRNEIVIRKKFTKPQVDLSAEERKKNIDGAFECSVPIYGQKFLVVDDVITSGSTINELAKLLKKAKAAEVWGLTVARG